MSLHRSKPRRSRPPVRRRVGPGLAFAVVTGVLGVLISPVVLLVSIARPGMRVGKRWVISIAVLTGICICVAWAAASRIELWSADAVMVLGAYDSARVKVRDLPFSEKVNFEGLRNGVDPCLLAAIMSQSSGFQTDAVSWRGARGLMQLMPAVWEEFMPGEKCRGDHAPPACSDTCIYGVDANLRVGAAYLRYLIDANQGDIIAALAAYSSGQSVELGEPVGSGASAEPAEPAEPGEAVAPGVKPGEVVDTAEPEPAEPGESADFGQQPLGYVRNIVQAWVNYRGEHGRRQTRSVAAAAMARSAAGWAAVGLLCLLVVWAAVRYPNPSPSVEPPMIDDQGSGRQPGRWEECAGGDPCVAATGDACIPCSGDADGPAV